MKIHKNRSYSCDNTNEALKYPSRQERIRPSLTESAISIAKLLKNCKSDEEERQLNRMLIDADFRDD